MIELNCRITDNNTVILDGYYDDSETNTSQLKLPKTINKLPIVEIANSAFSYQDLITIKSIPKTITKIGSNAFEGNELNSVIC